jgi:indolepyruvate ferredoxin oxidoreductase
VLRAMGLHRKIGFRSWTTPAIRMLARGKRLRGTRLDPFGRARVRRVERELPGGYVNAIDQVLSRLTPLNHPTAVAIAELPDIVRGFEHIKLQNVERYRAALAEALATL